MDSWVFSFDRERLQSAFLTSSLLEVYNVRRKILSYYCQQNQNGSKYQKMYWYAVISPQTPPNQQIWWICLIFSSLVSTAYLFRPSWGIQNRFKFSMENALFHLTHMSWRPTLWKTIVRIKTRVGCRFCYQ